MKNVYGFEHMAMQHLADETRKTGWEWIDAHPKMETPPVWAELEQPEEYPAGWWIWAAVTVLATVAVCVLVTA